jgi:xylitol oxidase
VRIVGEAPATNWAGNVTFSAATIAKPESVDELQQIVATAVHEGRRVSAVGSRHSFNRIADTDGVLIDTSALERVEFDEAQGSVWIGAGVRYAQLAPRLHAAGLALHNLPSLPHISVAGAVATATHGSGDRNRGLADSVEAVELVTADGELREIGRGDRHFAGAVVSLGALGVAARLRLRTEPTYEVAQTVYRDLPLVRAMPHLDEIMGLAYSVSLFTDWRSGLIDQVWVKQRTDRDRPPPRDIFGAMPAAEPCHPVPGAPTDACTEQLGRPGPWHERLAHFRADAVPSAGDELQSEYFVDRLEGPAAMEAVAAVSDEFADALLVSEVRSIAADDQWLSTTGDRARLGLHFTWRPDREAVDTALAAIESALSGFEPRPHWAKISTLDPSSVRERYRRFDAFRDLAEDVDPNHTFRNPYLDALLT